MGCNVARFCSQTAYQNVSVPSTGRSGLQPLSDANWKRFLQGFSTLYGSKWVATKKERYQDDREYKFQYPLRVEVGCNPPNAWSRRGCVPGFSTLYGSKWVATPGRAWGKIGSPNCFSTLYGSKWVATRVALDGGSWHVQVSVPSTGRSGLQPLAACSQALLPYEFQYPLRVEVGCNPQHGDGVRLQAP